ncbi:von Willebrand factor A domain-containing protein 7-like [Xyrauchen texanus]|uniref:von Willebrand factor A domain-containing protein 7-like n=1 Tax=Xyrauchen texanus TaxID=154827 RepID=UPI002242485D|nr:von Willebrand factor A domain-containing protein 7-like [Xyrauchen texanus]
MAILRATANVCKSLEKDFKEPAKLDVPGLALACKRKEYESNFEKGIKMICYHNVMIDLKHPSSEKHHFDSEKFKDGKELIINGIKQTNQNVSSGKFDAARTALGGILHTLQDFNSHSNWIELGNDKPFSDLINPDKQLTNLADGMNTCEENNKDKKSGAKLLQSIIDKKILTSGYFGLKKPKGKCSHGGLLDFTTGIGKGWDGMNKDYTESNKGHGAQHNKAAKVAIDATVELLEKILQTITGPNFLRLVGLHEDKIAGNPSIPTIDLNSRYPDANKPDQMV